MIDIFGKSAGLFTLERSTPHFNLILVELPKKNCQIAMDNNGLREQVMINQFVLAAGCSRDQASAILTQASWQFQTALSIYFEEATIHNKNASGFSLMTPANTPATPPNFPDALNMFSNLSTSDRMATSPLATSSLSPRSNQQTRNSFSPMMSPPPPQFNQQNTPTGFIQTNQQQPQPWRGHVNPSPNSAGYRTPQMGPPPPPSLQQHTTCDQSQQIPDVAEPNFLTMEMEGVPQ